MLLRASSQIRGTEVDLRAVTQGEDADSGVPHGDRLIAFADAAVTGDAGLGDARDALLRAMGPEAVVDAAGVVGNFQRMVRIADGTGIPLDKPVAVFSADMREELGIDDFGSAENTPPVRGVLRLLGRHLQPLVFWFMRRYTPKNARGSGPPPA